MLTVLTVNVRQRKIMGIAVTDIKRKGNTTNQEGTTLNFV